MNEPKNIVQQAAESIASFRQLVGSVEWTPRGILTSEGFAFCAMADLCKIDTVIESGIYSGRSTEIFARYLPNARIIGVDWQINPHTRERLSRYGVELIEGNATTRVVGELAKLKNRRTGIFIDGPKDDAAIELARACMRHEAVQFVGIHDMARLLNSKPHKARSILESLGGVQWYTDVEWFVEAYSYLDEDDSNWDDEQGTKWEPGFRCERGKGRIPLGSYGYTVGFLCR